ncbi:MAG: methyltransferase [Nitrospirae bacterium]|nr:methyltransferase [Nitrospirota bacterium]
MDMDLSLGHGRYVKLNKRRELEYKLIPFLSPDCKVLGGPFKGIVYNNIELTGSALIPKVIGSYESELHSVIEQVCRSNYSRIINIGAGEGYYAVGLAKRIPEVIVYAFDLNEQVLNICRTMAKENSVSDRIILDNLCTIQWLSEVKHTNGVLIFCDCEGCEIDLLDPDKLPNLNNWDVIVELHDFLNPIISNTIKQRFSGTHNILSIRKK